LPDVLVCVFVSNYQNIRGIQAVIERARKARNKLPVNRTHLIAVPLPSRDEIYNENAKAMEWRERYATELGYLYQDWLPKEVSPRDAMNKLFIPYVTIWSFGERIPILESSRETQDPTTLGAAYQRVATLLINRLSWYSLEERASTSDLQGTRVELQKAREEARTKSEEIERLAARRKRVRNWSLGTVAGLVLMFAAIAIPAYQDYTVRAQVIEGLNLASAVKAYAAEGFAQYATFPSSNNEIGLSGRNALSGKYVSSVNLGSHGVISIAYGGQSDGAITGKHVTFTPYVDSDNSIVWRCSSVDIKDGYLPISCRSGQSFATPLTDVACLEKALETASDEKPFQAEGGARCPSAGLSGRGKSITHRITFSAPPGFVIIGQPQLVVLSRIDGNVGSLMYEPDQGPAHAVHVDATCTSKNQPFGPGASMQIRISGRIGRPIDDASRKKAQLSCQVR
jgi:type IV pilus assembly protein PilA